MGQKALQMEAVSCPSCGTARRRSAGLSLRARLRLVLADLPMWRRTGGDLEEQPRIWGFCGAATLAEAQEFWRRRPAASADDDCGFDTQLAALDASWHSCAGRQQLGCKNSLLPGRRSWTPEKSRMNTQQLLASIDLSVAQSQLDAGSPDYLDRGKAFRRRRSWKKEKTGGWMPKSRRKKTPTVSKLITKDLIKGILAGENSSMPAGYLPGGEDEF